MQREESWTETYSGCSTKMAHCKQYSNTNYLSDDGGKSSTTQLKATSEYQDGVENHIEQGSADDAPHGITGITLHTQLTIECERGYLKRSAKQYDSHVLLGERKTCGGAAKHQRERTQKQQCNNSNQDACKQTIDEALSVRRAPSSRDI